ncbi:MAG: neutral zinc metallopeptidase [Novosphingobium sp.]|nr:neutral zinc metallopeptidase [Novosphingobium sp.]
MSDPDTAIFEHLAHQAMAALPSPFREHLGGILVRIEEFADSETLDVLGIDDAWGLSGLYHGRPIGQQPVTGEMPPVITLYRRPLLREWHETGVDLKALIAHVVVHEVGHHFGLSDDEMEALESDA